MDIFRKTNTKTSNIASLTNEVVLHPPSKYNFAGL